MGICSVPLASARARRRAENAGHSTIDRRAASSRERGPGGVTRMRGTSSALAGCCSGDNAIPSASLRLVKLGVGVFDEVHARSILLQKDRHPDGDRDVDLLSLEDEPAPFDFFAQTLRQRL